MYRISLGNTAKENATMKFMIKSQKVAILRLNVNKYQVRKQRCFQAGCIVTVFTYIPSTKYSSHCCLLPQCRSSFCKYWFLFPC